MMKYSQLVLTIILSAAVSFAVGMYAAPRGGAPAQPVKETAYERVIRTGTLRCGYADWPPNVLVKDPRTGKISGIVADVTDAIAGKLKLKVEWTENVGWGSFIESLRAHRIDAMCTGLWRNGERGRYVGFTLPIFYSAVYPYVAIDEHRFDGDVSAINHPGVRISVMDGEMSDIIAKTRFPNATEVSVPQLGQVTDILVNVATHKADIVFSEPSFAHAFMKANPNALRRAQNRPFQVFPTSLGVDLREVQLRDMLDSALAELHNQGVIEGIISAYSADPEEFLRVAKPYQ